MAHTMTINCPACGGNGGRYYWKTNPDQRMRAAVPQVQDWQNCGNCRGSGYIDVPDTRR